MKFTVPVVSVVVSAPVCIDEGLLGLEALSLAALNASVSQPSGCFYLYAVPQVSLWMCSICIAG
jgi:hypothetical protein